jgi:YHS domain-containing protein
MHLFTRRNLLLAIAMGLGCAAPAFAAGPLNLDGRGVALHGYDPVAYFVDGKPVKGAAERSAAAQGATYWFASDKNLELFKADPAKYAPQYGGYCAYGVAQGYKPDIDPAAFRVEGGKLYLNLSPDVQARWVKDIPGYIEQANKNWKTLKDQ